MLTIDETKELHRIFKKSLSYSAIVMVHYGVEKALEHVPYMIDLTEEQARNLSSELKAIRQILQTAGE